MSSQSTAEPAVTHGHLFVVRGKIGHVVADAAIIPTDDVFEVEPTWFGALGANNPQQAQEHRPSSWEHSGWGRSAKSASKALWFLDVVENDPGADDQFARLRRLLDAIAEAELTPKVQGRPLPLVVMPVIGTAGGGQGHRRGRVIRRLLEVCEAFVATHPLDVAIVAASPAPYAALQQRRRETARRHFPSIDLAAASELGNRAHNGSLALFLGAGTSVPAGAPSWKDLINRLTRRTRLDKEVKRRLKNLSPLDQAELLHQEFKGEELGRAVVQVLGSVRQPAIAHLLLAALDCESAVTTNYDTLYETAVRHSGDTVASVLPTQLPAPGSRWVLKMHGDVGSPASIVLTRDQFVAFTRGSGPAGAVLQSLLLTKHVLIVGTSMTDDNLLRLIHEVAAFRRHHLADGAPLDKFGTILDVGGDAARERLHRQHFAWRTMPGVDLARRARELEIFLDAVAMYAAGDHSWLLDPEFDDLHGERERQAAVQVRRLVDDLRSLAAPGSAWGALVESLDSFGAPEDEGLAERGAVDRVRRIAGRAHRRQVDKIGVPYIEHPAMVARFVQGLPGFADLPQAQRDDVLEAAWLHDVVEDTGESAESLRAAGVSARAVELVLTLTRRDGVDPDRYYAAIAQDPLATLVKVADIASNLAPERTRELPAATREALATKYTKALAALGESRATVDTLHQERSS